MDGPFGLSTRRKNYSSMKTSRFCLLMALCFIFSVSCTKEIDSEQIKEESNPCQFTDSDITVDGMTLKLKVSLEEAEERGISQEAYLSMHAIIDSLNERVGRRCGEVNTKGVQSSDIYGYGILYAEQDNNYSASMTPFLLNNYSSYTLMVSFNVVPQSSSSGAHSVFLHSGSIGQQYGPYYVNGAAFEEDVTSFVRLWYTYTPQTFNEQGQCAWLVLGNN